MVMTSVWITLTVCLLAELSGGADPVLESITSPDAVGNTVDDNSNVNWADIPQGQPYKASADYDDGGMGPLFNFARSFINTCFPKGFPYDLIEKYQAGKLDITSEAKDIVLGYIGYAIAVVVGFLFIIIFPIVGCCFCCCRCCGNCGGKKMQKSSPSASCKRKVFAVILLGLIAMSSAGMACVFVSNERMTTALSTFGDTAVDNIDDLSTFLNNTIEQVQRIGKNNFDFTKGVIFRDLDSLGYLVGIPVRTRLGAEGGITTAINNALGLQTVLDTATNDLNTVSNKMEILKTNVAYLKSNLTDVTAKITAANVACGCPPPVDTTGLTVGFDESKLPNVTDEMSQLNSVQSQNLTKSVLEARKEFDDIPEKVQNDTISTVNNLKSQVNDYSSSVDPMINMTENMRTQALGSIDIDSLQKQIKDLSKDVAKYDKYRWYAGIGLSSIILLIIVLLFFGLVCGVFGSSASEIPTERGCMSTTGGNLLMASVGFIFIFSWLFMLLTTLTFVIGAPVERFVCQPLSDPELTIFTKLIDEMSLIGGSGNGSFLGNMLFKDSSIDLTIAGVLKNCKNGQAAYTAFKLENFKDFNITAMMDYKSKMDIDGQLDSINVDMSTVEILSPSLETQLGDFKSAVTGINFTEFDELNKDTVQANLSALSKDLRDKGDANLAVKTQLYQVAQDLDDIENGIYKDTHDAKNDLITSSQSLESSFATIATTIDTVTNSLNTTEQFLHTNGSGVVKDEARNFGNRLTAVVDSFVADAKTALDDEIGRCTPIYNIYASLLVNGFCRYMLDAFNGFWFSLGWCIFFFVPSVIFAVKLAKYYRRMNMLDSFEAPSMPEKRPPSVSVSNNPGPIFGHNKVGHAERW